MTAQLIEFYTAGGELITDEDTLSEIDLLEARVSFEGGEPVPAHLMRISELRTVSAYFAFLGANNERRAEAANAVLKELKGYPKGTTLSDVTNGTATKLTAVGGDD
ncbi:hypothetical protein [Chryseoglobus sp. 28M-23]|uniref:hypothetical protein n=1 Tax=Chryseoglobus sp. 28M-23 TaxID=2772253 RepID=UPI001746B92F|nr:hypothetical protein [Chryseoglobus sp. 28M-23]QOD93485.1 hypothetical protein IE160_11360 [Chryseoglobus sp. 28M-23]